MFDVCVVGSANLDLVASVQRLPDPGETVLATDYAEHPGGKGLNQAVSAARSGASVAFIGALGDGAAGAALRAVMRAEGIDTASVATVNASTGRALIGVAASGENSIIVVPGANAAVTVGSLPACRVLLAQLEVPLDAVAAALAAARAGGAITMLNPAPAQLLDDTVLGLCDVVVPNEHEVLLLGGSDRLLNLGAKAVVVTRGADGADLHTADGVQRVAAFAVAVVDTTGAGDAFCGALAAQLATGSPIADALRYAAAAGALATSKAGAVPSMATRAEIETLMASLHQP